MSKSNLTQVFADSFVTKFDQYNNLKLNLFKNNLKRQQANIIIKISDCVNNSIEYQLLVSMSQQLSLAIQAINGLLTYRDMQKKWGLNDAN